LVSEAIFKDQLGTFKAVQGRLSKNRFTIYQGRKEAGFAGGPQTWVKFFQKNLDANLPFANRSPACLYRVFVKFIVATDGSVSEVNAETSHGYGMEKEVIRIIKKGPAWEPAIQYGRKVNAYRRQPITFIVEVR